MCRFSWLMQLFVWGMLAASSTDGANADDQVSSASDIDDAQISSAMQAWSRLLNGGGPTEYAAVLTSQGKGNAYYREYEFHLKRRGDSVVYTSRERLIEADGKQQGEHYSCYGRNSDYWFELAKSRAEDPWSLARLALGPEDPDVAYFEKYLHIFVTSIDMGTLLIHDDLISRLLDAPSCTVLRCDEVQHGNDRLLEVEFKYDAAKDEKNVLRLAARSMHVKALLDPARSFSVREATTVLSKSGYESHDVYDSEPGHDQIKRSRTSEWTSGGQRYSEALNVATVSFERRFAESEFRLPAFGLPEPEGFERGRPYLTWFLGLLAVSLVVGGLWLFSRRR